MMITLNFNDQFYKLKPTKETQEQTALAVWLINNYINIASNIFKYEGLDAFGEDLTSEIVERGYIFNGVNVAFKDKNLGNLCLPAMASSKLNVYGIPQQYNAVGYNGKTWNLSTDNAVLLRNNGTFSPDLPLIVFYCERIADCEMAIKTNINVNKRRRYDQYSCNSHMGAVCISVIIANSCRNKKGNNKGNGQTWVHSFVCNFGAYYL